MAVILSTLVRFYYQFISTFITTIYRFEVADGGGSKRTISFKGGTVSQNAFQPSRDFTTGCQRHHQLVSLGLLLFIAANPIFEDSDCDWASSSVVREERACQVPGRAWLETLTYVHATTRVKTLTSAHAKNTVVLYTESCPCGRAWNAWFLVVG